MKVVFKNEKNEELFIVTEEQSKKFIIPKKGEGIIWMKLYMFVDLVEHNYDSKEISVLVTVQ